MSVFYSALCSFVALCAVSVAASAETSPEGDFFGELPEVLSVTRLYQPLSDTPGALSIIDREAIRRSGAREITELLRLVPGFVLHHMSSGARPVASYHASYSDISRHTQVMIDGRSVYSSLLLGSANNGLMGLVLEDIERIEILRGSNSAALGGNAFHGVINIITRHAGDVPGFMIGMNRGEGGVNDATARLGWGGDRAAYRLTVASRRDSGYAGLHDDKGVEQGHLRADWTPSARDELMLTAGFVRYDWGMQSALPAALARTESWSNGYANLRWIHQVTPTEELRFAAHVDSEHYENYYPRFRADGRGLRTELEAQHSFSLGPTVRFVWGGQYRREEVISPDLFHVAQRESFQVWRGFGNIEWKPHPRWIVNLGGLAERHSVAGAARAPRLMANFHIQPGHTLRLGGNESYRQPTLFESRADWRSGGVQQFLASGGARAERVSTSELGYLGDFRPLALIVDVRLFRESVRDLLIYSRPCADCPIDIVNRETALQRGWEMQLRWRPWPGTELWANHTELRLMPGELRPQDRHRAPARISSYAWFQHLPRAWELSLIHYEVGSRFVVRLSDMIPEYRQTDLRLGRRFMLGATRIEAALNVRALAGSRVDYVERNMPDFVIGRRAHVSLKIEY